MTYTVTFWSKRKKGAGRSFFVDAQNEAEARRKATIELLSGGECVSAYRKPELQLSLNLEQANALD